MKIQNNTLAMGDLITIFINRLVNDKYDDTNHILKYFNVEKIQHIVNSEIFSCFSARLTEKQNEYILSCLNIKLIDSDTKYLINTQTDESFVEKSLKLLNDYHRINRFIINICKSNKSDTLGTQVLEYIWNIFASYSTDIEICYCDKRIDIDEKYEILYKSKYPESFLCLEDCCILKNINTITSFNTQY